MPGEQRFAFDAVADVYDRARPGYPPPLFDDVISLSGIAPGGRILEIGCGTGQATADFARRGFRMLCLEPGPSLARRARERLAMFPKVNILPHTFEAWPLDAGAFDLVISAQAFHWVAHEVRFAKSAAALHRDGALAVFGNAVVVERSPLREALDRIYARHAPSMAVRPSARWYSEEGPVRALFSESGRFGPAAWRSYPWSRDYAPDEYQDLLRTHSDHRLLPPDVLESLLTAVRHAIDSHGGKFNVRYEAHLYVAHRVA